MAIIYHWRVEQMNSYPENNGHYNVVFNVHWRCNAQDGNYTATNYGSIIVSLNLDEPFTPYVDLTQDQVIAWTKAAIGKDHVDQIEAGLARQIANLISPPIVTLPNPWDNPQ